MYARRLKFSIWTCRTCASGSVIIGNRCRAVRRTMTKVKMLLLPVETARKLQVDLPRKSQDCVLLECPQCSRLCWASVDQERRIQCGEAEPVCVKCEQDRVISESFRRMLRGEGGK